MVCTATQDLDRVMPVEIDARLEHAVAVELPAMAVPTHARISRRRREQNRRDQRGNR